MKKLFFSAVAFIAFSTASMANTIADEQTIKENVETIEIQKIEVQQKADIDIPWEFIQTLNECIGVYNDVKATYTAVVGAQQANAIAQGAFVGCLGGI